LSPTSFILDNDEKLLELSNITLKEERLQIIAIFHSHPAGANPSSFDRKSMKYYHNCGIKKFTHLVWIIVDSRNKNINGFIYLENKLFQIRVEVSKK
jgi:proteasome lid subunit RPN8/RPN11